MHISSLKVSNYKSFRNSDEISLSKGFNIIVGKNNSGKTALAEASTTNIPNKPHISENTIPYRNYKNNKESEIDLEIVFEEDEVWKFVVNNFSQINLPIDRSKEGSSRKQAREFVDNIKGIKRLSLCIRGN
jgi:AAA15 family ATPase/GTPase